jgi:hypothetical protein
MNIRAVASYACMEVFTLASKKVVDYGEII